MNKAQADSRAILTVEESYRADALAMQAGVSGERLMEAAGWAVAHAAWTRFTPCRVTVLCGPGNNGGDGFVAARFLERRGYCVRVGLLGKAEALTGDAALMASRWKGGIEPWSPALLERADLVIDAVFGAGLSRPVDGDVAALFNVLEQNDTPVIAIDVPSGVDGNSGQVLGTALSVVATVTFFRKKPGHVLLPGRSLCGEVVVADIGTPLSVLDPIGSTCFEDHPGLWSNSLPKLDPSSNKYSRGHVLLLSGESMTGAIRLAAMAARRTGAGLATVAAPAKAADILRGADAGTIITDLDRFPELLADPRYNVVVIGPGAGVSAETRHHVQQALAAHKTLILDADGLTSFASAPSNLFQRTNERVVMTPHEGEFKRLWGDVPGDKIDRTRTAAKQAGCVVLLKGADTVIAHPDGRAIVNTNAPPWLATAGAGDVLAGIIAGYCAQGMDSFMAAAASVWRHGECAQVRGKNLLAEDLIESLQ